MSAKKSRSITLLRLNDTRHFYSHYKPGAYALGFFYAPRNVLQFTMEATPAMSKKNKAARAADYGLQEIYDALPTMECKGLCQASCGRIEECLTPRELDRILGVAGVDEIPANIGCVKCPLLDVHGQCSVYDVRPLICRLWGMVYDELMMCPFGCRPSRYLSNDEVGRIWAKLNSISKRYTDGRRTVGGSEEAGHEMVG